MKNIVAIDVGNSETTVGVGNNLSWRSYRYTTRKTITSDELFMMFKTTIDPESINDENLDGSIICSVVPQITESVVEATERFTSKKVYTVGPGIKTGLKVNIDNPKELGPDRIANSVGGFKMAQKSVIIVDLGTATTFDVVKTSSLKSVEILSPKSVIGKNTYEAIQSGLILGHASMIDSMLEKIILETGTNPKIVITGGLGEVIQPLLNVETEYSKDLTLNGLEEIYFLNN